MVFYFTSSAQPDSIVYMGRDKYENEELIKYGWEEDVWFHADKFSSAHVYLRLKKGETWDKINPDLLNDLAQLTKANSIEGNKKDHVTIIYTPWSNLKKTPGMDVGQVSFFNQKMVKRIKVEKRVNEIINRLNKTKVERNPDLNAEKIAHERQLRQQKYAEEKRKREIEMKKREDYQKMYDMKNYVGAIKEEEMKSNKFDGDVDFEEFEDDFM
ncbi:hypothetical protein BCR36DRAFT_585975 [Piromyces finnis]|uniref:NFACT RNA-binding domain-containing protein n=1 Tax=Piromyces finnis TaxID=1754191 RepID=A0A1Y1V0Y2_9FUNG|nr:hypothetical protein BCR36DRAFT_585975 [Piromyces finnis]|eukprot:ORX44864.1 hypothetical protein BCR36DRAFT_585975 [Piromyces finnis]